MGFVTGGRCPKVRLRSKGPPGNVLTSYQRGGVAYNKRGNLKKKQKVRTPWARTSVLNAMYLCTTTQQVLGWEDRAAPVGTTVPSGALITRVRAAVGSRETATTILRGAGSASALLNRRCLTAQCFLV